MFLAVTWPFWTATMIAVVCERHPRLVNWIMPDETEDQ